MLKAADITIRSTNLFFVSFTFYIRNKPLLQDYNDELEKLRAEVRRYRLELYNRDNNFNRVFSERTLKIDPNAGLIGVSSSHLIRQSSPSAPTHTQISSLAVQGREKSFTYDIVQGFEESVSFSPANHNLL